MLEVLALIVLTLVLPVLINKSTEVHFDWLRPHLRPIWTAVFAFYSLYLLNKPTVMEVSEHMRQRFSSYPLVGYIVAAGVGAILLCGYWWFAGKVFRTRQQLLTSSITMNADDRQLCNDTYSLARRMRDFEARCYRDNNERMEAYQEELRSSADQHQTWLKYTADSGRLRDRQRQDSGPYYAEAIVILEKLLRRLPNEPKPSSHTPDAPIFLLDGAMAGPYPVTAAANYLETLAMKLCG